VFQATTVFGLNFNVPLASLTRHNTSAYSNYTQNTYGANFGTTSWISQDGTTMTIDSSKMDRSLNPITPGHVSHVDVHTLIPSRPDLRWFANGTCWFGEGSHINIGVNNNTSAYAAAMVSDLERRGFNGLIFSWYGKGDQTDDVAKKVKAYLASASNTNKNFRYIIMVVFGYFNGGESATNLEANINYCKTNYFNDPNYETDNGRPILMFFNVRSSSYMSATDMANIKAATDPNVLWVDEHTGHINESWVDMTYQWTDCFTSGVNSSDRYNLRAVTNEFSTVKSHSTKQAFGAMCAHFNGTLTKSVGWSEGKYLPGDNGLCEVERAAAINAVIPTNMTRMQWATWNDWEEGTEVESGTENNFALAVRMSTSNVLSRTITSGDERTVDHYEIYAATNGGNAAFLCSVQTGIYQTNLSQIGLTSGNYQFYVDAIGKPCIRDHLSQAASYGLPYPWLNQDIGSVGVGGGTAYTNGIFTVSGSGTDIWGSSDSFQFVYQPWSGDGQIVARVASIQNTAPVAKAGLMFRQTLNPSSAQGDLFVSPISGVSMQKRMVADGSTSNVRTLNDISAPCWLSLIRMGNYFYSYESADGINWTPVGTNSIPMTTNIYVGLCVTSKSNTVLNTATFDHVAVGSSTVVGMPVLMVNVSNFTSKLKITFSGYNRGETLKDFPVLVRLGTNVPGFSYGQFASPTGDDLRFTDAGGTREIPYEIDQWNPDGISTVWVQVPDLSSTNDFIWAYWGNPAEATVPDYTTNGAVWVPPAFESLPSFDLVYHLEQNGFPYFDSTLQHPATSGIAPGLTNGLIGLGGSFTRSPYLDAGAIDLGSAFTVSAWINTALVNDEQGICANGGGGYSLPGFKFFVNSYQTSDGTLNFLTGNGSAGTQLSTGAGAVSQGQWHLVTAVVDHDGGSAQLYVDGDLSQSGAIRNDFPDTTNNVNVGQYPGGSFAFLGLMDETRIRSGLSSSNWVWASWMTVAQNASFESYSAVDTSIVTISIQRLDHSIILTWPEGTLQSADRVAGPYSDILSATSPYTNTVSEIQQFYRVHVQ
jgi:hypothetical protein